MDILVTYDIATTESDGARRLAQVAKVCESYGVRVQYSVFECRLDDRMLASMMSGLLEAIDSREDSIKIYRLNAAVSVSRTDLGRHTASVDRTWIV